MIAPRERDLQMVLDDDLTGWDEYREIAGPVELDLEALGLYRRLWAPADMPATSPRCAGRMPTPRICAAHTRRSCTTSAIASVLPADR